jgi:hypothetical protein
VNITDVFTELAKTRPDHPAIEDGDRIISYGDLDPLVNNCAANLQNADNKGLDFRTTSQFGKRPPQFDCQGHSRPTVNPDQTF